MSSSSLKPSEKQWLRHQDRLGDLGFRVTANQLEYKLKKWKFRKNIDKSTWVEIDHCISKRKRAGKDSEVIFCGKRVKLETVEKETNRHRDRRIFAQLALQQSSSPVVPADTQVSVCTPQPLSMEFEWPSTLPWLRFPAKDLQIILSAYTAKTLDNEKIRPEALVSAIFHRENQLTTNIAQFGVSKLAAIIGTSMPESYSQEHLQRAQCLLSGSREEYLFETLSMVIYGLSNNIYNLYEEDQWKATMTILKTSGLLEISVNLKNLKSWTIDGFMENLFRAAMDRLNNVTEYVNAREIMAVLKWLLALGQSPISLYEKFGHLFARGSFKSTAFEGSTDPVWHKTMLEIVLRSNGSNDVVCRIAKLLLKHGASVNLDRALHSAIRRRDRDLIDMILQHGGSLYAELECPDGFVYKETALTVAAATGLSETQYILDLLASWNPSKPVTEFINADVLISAAAHGKDDIVSYLHSKSGIVIANHFGIMPLHAAAHNGHLSTCQLLFTLHGAYVSGVMPMFSPLHIACHARRPDIVHFLITKDVNVNAVARGGYTDEEQRTVRRAFQISSVLRGYEVVCATSSCLSYDLLSAALAAGADPNEKNAEGTSALQLALLWGWNADPEPLYDIVALLLRNGATLLGGEVVLAIRLEDWDLVDLLLKYGGRLLDTGKFGVTALEATIEAQHASGLTRLFETEPGIYDAGSLCAAIATGDNSTLQQLLTNRRTKPIAHTLEVTAVGMAAELGNLGLLRSLLEHPPSCKIGPMPSLYIVEADQIIQYKRRKYDSDDRHSYTSGSPLALVAGMEFDEAREACSELLKNGFQADRLTWAVAAGANNLAFAQFLLDHDQRYQGDSRHEHRPYKIPNPLLAAVKHHNKELIALLLRAGVDVNEHRRSTWRGRSPLQWAVELGDFEMVRYLIEAGANVNSPPAFDYGATALQLAAIKGHLGIAKYLIDFGARVNALPARFHGRTALEGAAEWGRLDMLELLLASGARKTGDWHRQFVRAVKMAIKQGHHTAANLLKQSLGWSEEDESLFQTEGILDHKA
ncbi:hypothetical protein E0Z10_g7836 [Xylaria hypoxylon]|uniref:Clr5 domain-containing protein n=1 Tax=Xylaria hypoxylon TaxID=37992 RepID=A0A4Z0YAK5_9PEZI|nr:hypothetical protein E0Z10_g7836 [Xylaria hypoxylon]